MPALLVTIVYPFTKRFFAMPQTVLGVAFSMGMPMAYAAVQDSVPGVVVWMLIANLCWTLAYDTEYAMVDRDDDLRIGMKTSAITLGRFDVAGIMAFYAVHTGVWWTIFWLHAGLGHGAPGWKLAVWSLTLAAVVAQVGWHWHLIHRRQRDSCFVAFRENHWIGLTVFVAALLLA